MSSRITSVLGSRITSVLGSGSLRGFNSLIKKVWVVPHWSDSAIPFPAKDADCVWDLALSFSSFYSDRLPKSILDDILFYKIRDDLQPIHKSVSIETLCTSPEEPLVMKRRIPKLIHVDCEGMTLQVPTEGCLLVNDIIEKLIRENARCSHLSAKSILLKKGSVILNSIAEIPMELEDFGTASKPLSVSHKVPLPTRLYCISSEYGHIDIETSSCVTVADVARKFIDSDIRFATFQITDLVFRTNMSNEPLRLKDRLTSLSLHEDSLLVDCLYVKVQFEDICEVSIPFSKISTISRLAFTLSEIPELKRFNHRQFIFSETESGARLSLGFKILEHLTGKEVFKLYGRVFRKTIKIAEFDIDGNLKNSTCEMTFASDDEIARFINDSNGSGLVSLPTETDKKLIRSLSLIDENRLYKVEKLDSKPSTLEAWIKSDSRVQELETENCLIRYLKESGTREIKVMPRVIMGYRIYNNSLVELKQEWDACIYSYDTSILYVAECKHDMTTDYLDVIESRRTTLSEILLNPKTNEYKDLDITKIQVVAAGKDFTNYALLKAIDNLGFLAISPSGSRYMVSDKIHA